MTNAELHELVDRLPDGAIDGAAILNRDRLEAATAHAALLVTATMIQHVGELIGPA